MAKTARKSRPQPAAPVSGLTRAIERMEMDPAALLRTGEIALKPPARYSRDEPVLHREGMHNKLVDKRRITEAQWTWAERYCREIEVLQGARDGSPITGDRDGQDGPIYDRGVAAAWFVRTAHGRMTQRQIELMIGACVLAMQIKDLAPVAGYPRVVTVTTQEDRRVVTEEGDKAYSNRVGPRVYRAVAEAIAAGSGIKERESA